jgi:hypothetical protein
MTKTILLTFTLLSCTAWMMAQSTPSSSSSPDTSSSGQSSASQSSAGQNGASAPSQSGSMNGSETTIRGCLNSSGGGYSLTDASGTTYQLQGDTSKLSAHVNNEVEVKGTASGASGAGAGASASAGSAGSTGGSQTFNVTKVKKVASSCSTSK